MPTYDDINAWFERHFNGTTPGTELYALQQRALADLHNLLGTNEAAAPAPEETETPENHGE